MGLSGREGDGLAAKKWVEVVVEVGVCVCSYENCSRLVLQYVAQRQKISENIMSPHLFPFICPQPVNL